MNTNKENAIRNLENVKDEMEEESVPDKLRIGKWLEKAKEYLIIFPSYQVCSEK